MSTNQWVDAGPDDVDLEAEQQRADDTGSRPGSRAGSWERPAAGRRPGAGGQVVAAEPGPAQDPGEAGATTGSGREAGGLHERVRAAVGEIQWVSQRPASLRDHVAYARLGRWTPQVDGRLRHLQLLWAWVVAIPVSTVAYLAVWSVSRGPARAAAVWGIALLLATALNQIPVLEWLIPDWASIPDWF